MRLPTWLSQHLAALRALLVFTALLGIAYPVAVLAIGQLPGLRDQAGGSLVESGGSTIGSALIGQSFTDADGNPLVQYFQTRPSAGGYDPTASGASNLGPESVVDGASPSLLSQVCARSLAVGRLNGVDGSRPYCTADGVGAVLAVFRAGGLTGPITRAVSVNQPCPAVPFMARYQDVAVECAAPGEDYSAGVVTPIRAPAGAPVGTDEPAIPVVPPDAVTASGSGLDPDISPAYAALQADRVARVRGVDAGTVQAMIQEHTTGRALGFLGEPAVNVLELNMELDQRYPYAG
jgi:K+-transporting ATPase ATPase C chain